MSLSFFHFGLFISSWCETFMDLCYTLLCALDQVVLDIVNSVGASMIVHLGDQQPSW